MKTKIFGEKQNFSTFSQLTMAIITPLQTKFLSCAYIFK